MNAELGEAGKDPSADVTGNDENPRQSLDDVPVASSASTGAEDADPRAANLAHEGEEAEWPDDELDAIAQQDNSNAEFKAAERHFQSIENPSLADQILFEAAEMEEEARERRVAAREAFQAENQSTISNEKDSGAVLDEQVPAEVMAQPSESTGQRSRVPRNRKNRLSAEEKRKSKKYGLNSVLKQMGQKTARKSRKRKSEDTTPDPEPVDAPKRKKAKGFTTQASKEFLRTLITPNVIEDAHASASAQAMPEFGERDKEKAFRRMIASIPAADLAEAKSDHKQIINASRKFSKGVRKDGTGGYRIPGMRTSLYHYQLLGAAFMRDRENSSYPPYGGFLSDFMGLGKTIQALANIVDGRPSDPEDPIKTTLIVVPSHLVSHWKNQIIRHCDGIKLKEIVTYCAGHRLDTLDIVGSLQEYSIIITTYDEVRRSYPQSCKPPAATGTEDEVIAWWDKHYEEHLGPLHKIKYHRIILDEGHLIRNHGSAVSMAVCALTGTNKWILSGTPIHNYIDELFPQFDFLGVPGTKTHETRLFSFPLVKLPDVRDEVIKAEFCDAERELYNAIEDLFIQNINQLAKDKHPKLAQYRCFLTMILILRMFCSHLLTAHDIIKKLLSERLLMAKLSRMANGRGEQDPTFIIVQRLIAIRSNPTVICDKREEHLVHSPNLQGDREKLVRDYYDLMLKLHESEQWDERLKRNSCPHCKYVPVYPVITSCHHLYCEECYSFLSVNVSTDEGKPICRVCQEPIQEAAYCDAVEDIELTRTHPTQNPQQETAAQSKKNKSKAGVWRKPQGSFRRPAYLNSDEEPPTEPDADEQTDWIEACASQMPSAKMTKIQDLVAKWLAESPRNKIVIFTQFLDFIRILGKMCQREKWPVTSLTGKMNLAKREASMKQFSDVNGNTNIMLASLKAGGIGLDLTAANKCILVDLWWNDAVQDQANRLLTRSQAFCRLWRIGQTQEVEYKKIIVSETIDDYLLRLQSEKLASIEETIGDEKLKGRDTMAELLNMFADVQVENGAFRLTRKPKKSNASSKPDGKVNEKQNDPPESEPVPADS
ncbi:hypothetical protein ASPACDRAFT_26205 [Aspergillus aculeatus ATCC 16872]|uniref:RING-type domain-containing protein n=1 Tax=Aspergillus aculeatus (strain ATCC 16872 / CBS 172.66 / WB 5094) TaxID=690307 RepID=A0A1L9WZL4_ASPA1|nr:uncharacterized protein ASPACDRAFT_26205 [Aspergillus aculeatus ATCC 16872]OJK01489.1 hypothetical protein ASPACDRAFT_26205 [Aspergillus aculeatus ATCC 16872]